MFKKMKHMKNEKGLTLIELLAVIVILAIIAAIAIPAIGNIINNTRDKAVLSDIQAAVSAAKIAKADGSCTSATLCKGSDFEFISDKIKNVGTTTAEDIEVTFDTTGKITAIVAKLEGDLKGEKMKTKLTSTRYTASGTGTSASIQALSESDLNTILGGN